MDFTLSKYEELCKVISHSEYKVMTVRDYLIKIPRRKFIILRHDVDKNTESALKIARIEKKHGLKSTFYFRIRTFKPKVIKKIEKLGHEIGYHYEVLDKTKGDFEKAIRLFEEELKLFRRFCDVKTICMHGNPLTKWINKDLWKKYDFKEFGILGEAYSSFDFSEIAYFSDTGRDWSKIGIKINIEQIKSRPTIKSTRDLIERIKSENFDNLYIVTHPQRWSNNIVSWVRELIFQDIKNVGKKILFLVREHRV